MLPGLPVLLKSGELFPHTPSDGDQACTGTQNLQVGRKLLEGGELFT